MEEGTGLSTFSFLSSRLPAAGWSLLEGDVVEIYSGDKLVDKGTIDAVTPDGQVVWLSQEGANHRRLVQKEPGMTVVVNSSSTDGLSPSDRTGEPTNA